MSPEIINNVDKAGVISMLIIDDVKHAVPVAKALFTERIDAIELILRTSAALDAVKAIKKELPEVCLGFGIVLTIEQVKAVSPGSNLKNIAEANKLGLSFSPRIMTPSDI